MVNDEVVYFTEQPPELRAIEVSQAQLAVELRIREPVLARIGKSYVAPLMALAVLSQRMTPELELDFEKFDVWNEYLSEPLRAEELKPFLINQKNKPFYRRFEGGKKWKF